MINETLLRFFNGRLSIAAPMGIASSAQHDVLTRIPQQEVRSMADNPATTKRPTAEALKIAEAYYMVARDLEQNAHQQLDIARRLNTYADWLCEQNARQDSAGASRDE